MKTNYKEVIKKYANTQNALSEACYDIVALRNANYLLQNDFFKLKAERDILKSALENIIDCEWDIEGLLMQEIANEALAKVKGNE